MSSSYPFGSSRWFISKTEEAQAHQKASVSSTKNDELYEGDEERKDIDVEWREGTDAPFSIIMDQQAVGQLLEDWKDGNLKKYFS